MEEIEDPTEKLKEMQQELLEKESEIVSEKKEENWVRKVALTTAIIAVFAAITGLTGSHHSNEALIDQIKASDQWAYYQAKGIKGEIYTANANLLKSLEKEELAQASEKKAKKYEDDKKEIMDKAKEKEESSEHHLRQHVTFSYAVTIFQVAIAICATAIITRKKFLWYCSIGLSLVGAVLSVLGFLAQ